LRTEEGQNPQKNPQDILLATFDVIWNSYSIDVAIYSPFNEESEFKKNLERLREELGVHLQPTLIAAGLDNSVLRAGYTSEWGAKATVIASLVVNGKCGRLRPDPGRSKLADLRAVTPKAVASCQPPGIGSASGRLPLSNALWSLVPICVRRPAAPARPAARVRSIPGGGWPGALAAGLYSDAVRFLEPDGTVLVSDGGLATELEARGHDLSDSLWSARLLMDAPEEITAAHLAFFQAGAVIATAASYQASFGGFAARGLARSDAARLMRLSVELAQAARAEVADDGRTRWVAASVGPYGAALADGSEYRGRYGLSVAELVAWHRPRLEVLAEAGPDVLALETVPDLDEAEALMTAICGLGIPAWLTFSIQGERTRAGQPVAEAYAVARDVPEVVAVGVNCCAPSDVLPVIAIAGEVTGKPVIVYPNSGEDWDAQRRTWAGPSQSSAGQAQQWVAEGARIVGGCCRVRPADIAEIALAVGGC